MQVINFLPVYIQLINLSSCGGFDSTKPSLFINFLIPYTNQILDGMEGLINCWWGLKSRIILLWATSVYFSIKNNIFQDRRIWWRNCAFSAL